MMIPPAHAHLFLYLFLHFSGREEHSLRIVSGGLSRIGLRDRENLETRFFKKMPDLFRRVTPLHMVFFSFHIEIIPAFCSRSEVPAAVSVFRRNRFLPGCGHRQKQCQRILIILRIRVIRVFPYKTSLRPVFRDRLIANRLVAGWCVDIEQKQSPGIQIIIDQPEYLQEIFRQNRLVSQTFSARMLETGEAAVRFSEALAAEKYRNVQLQEKLLEITAESYVNQENVLHIEDDLTGGQLRSLADKIADKCTGFAAVLSRQPDGSYGYCIASRALDLRPMGKALNGALNGRGGGKPGFQQGTLRAEEGQIREFFREQGA
jgi:hypothetical protein